MRERAARYTLFGRYTSAGRREREGGGKGARKKEKREFVAATKDRELKKWRERVESG